MAGYRNQRGRDHGPGRGRGHYSSRSNYGGFSANDFNNSGGQLNEHLAERFRGSRRKMPLSPTPSINLELSLNNDIRKYIHAQAKFVESAERGDWRGLKEIPTNDEIALAADDEVTLIPNKIKGKWKSKERYLRAHYELHREDAVSPLRDAVDKFRKNPSMGDDQTLSVYEKVHIAGFTFSPLGIAARIRFSTARAGRHILWQSSKRLVSGTLVALTPSDNKFESRCIVALVAARPLVGLEANPPEIDIFFCRPEDIHIDPQQEWIMVEARQGYYEAYRHTLKSLQKLSHETFPLSPQICSLSADIGAPAYLKENPNVSLAPATAQGQESYGDVDILNDWPSHSQSGLDETQWAALQQILSKSLAVVQGPPGTGKTYVSQVALHILHSSLKDDDPPIIVAAQTNHALDQLLGHVAKFEPSYIRLGGRSTNIEVKKRALFEIRSKECVPLLPGGLLGKATGNWKLQSKKMQSLLEPLHESTEEPLLVKTLAEHGILTGKQCQSLSAGASRWVTSDGSETDPLRLWLDRALIPFEVKYGDEYFGLNEEDEDLEVEQLREHEAEHGVNDEEDRELLKGPWCMVQDNWTVVDPVESDLERAAELLDTSQDLWKVPDSLRGPMYKVLQQRLIAVLQTKFRQLATEYEKNLMDLNIGKWERDAMFLKRAKIIGLTTTGLSKYRPLIASLKPKIILIEEAAEVLEAPVTVACMESVEHLILVGDHQQLQGHCSVQELEGEPYYLNVSLFERLVRNKIPFRTLLQQRRMHPSFRKLIQPLYPALEDHSSVISRESLDWGMGSVQSFFFSHEWSEYKDGQMSTYNEEEAKFIAGFYRYLTQNGIPTSKVTILTFYNGQRKRLLKEIRAFSELRDSYNNVKTVDSYQGEENEIVILSLTRSNSEGKIGFLEINNRVCVALSRAKQGFYLFGNSNLLASRSQLWNEVINIMSALRRLANQQLPLYCEKHKVTTIVEYADDWSKYHGGCAAPCGFSLPCGHPCMLKCHPFPHEKVFCGQGCQRQLACGHKCENKCSEVCSCNCEAFFEAQKEAWEPSYNGHIDGASPSLDVRRTEATRPQIIHPGMGGVYISGQHGFHSRSTSGASYLPQQVPNLIQLNEPGMPMEMGRTRPQTGSGHGYLPTRKRSPTSSQDTNGTVDSCRLTPAEQASSRNGWNMFAAGGVKDDDERRERQEWSANMQGPNMKAKGWPHLKDAVKDKKTEVLGGGRSKFTQEYQPAAYGAAWL